MEVVAGDGHALAHEDFIGGAADAGDVDAFGAALVRQSQHFGLTTGRHQHLAQDRLMAVYQDVDLLGFQHAEVGARADGHGPAEEHVLHVGGDHGAAPAIGERGAHGGAQ